LMCQRLGSDNTSPRKLNDLVCRMRSGVGRYLRNIRFGMNSHLLAGVGSVWLPRYILAGVILPSTNALYQFVAMPGTFVPGLTAKKVGQKGVCAPFLFPRGRYYARIDKKGILLR